jgi:hypothetical protein
VFDEDNDGDPIADIASLADAALGKEAVDLAARHTAGEHIIVPGPMWVALSETHDLTWVGNGGCGGIISTSDELPRIFMELLSGHLLTPGVLDEVMAPTEASYDTYGLGRATYSASCGPLKGHERSVNGTRSIVIVTAGGTRGVVVAISRDRG